MTDRLADTALRLLAPRAVALGFGDGDSLQNIIVDELPNGALCWVNANATLYRLDKLSTLTPAGDAIIQPLAGPGRWIALVGGAASNAARMSVFGSGEDTVLVGGFNQNLWLPLPVFPNGGPYAPHVPGSVFWSIDSNSGVATYSGPPAIYHFNAGASVTVDADVLTRIEASLTVNGQDIGGSSARPLQMHVKVANVDDVKIIALAVEIALNTNDTVQLIVRNSSGPDDLIVGPMQITGLPA